MLRLAGFARWVLLALFLPVVLPVMAEFAKRLVDSLGWYEHPEQAAGWLMGTLTGFAQVPWVFPTALILGGLTAGAWLDWLLRRLDGSRAARRKDIGRELLSLAAMVQSRQDGWHGEWPNNIHDLWPLTMSIFIKAEQIGIWAPTGQPYEIKAPTGPNILINYLRFVGTMLADGHFTQARKRANQLKGALENGVLNAKGP